MKAAGRTGESMSAAGGASEAGEPVRTEQAPRPGEAGRLGPEVRAFLAWRRAGGTFGRIVFAAPFFGRYRADPAPGRSASAQRLLRRLLPGPLAAEDAVFLDLDPALSLAALAYLRTLSDRIIPLIARWPAEPAILPVTPLLTQLVQQAPGPQARLAARHDSPGAPIFLLDGARAGPTGGVSPRTLSHRFDNRYEYQQDYLPPAELLIEEGCRRAIWISPAGAAAPDLIEYEKRLLRAGLAVEHRAADRRPGNQRRVSTRS